MLLEGAESLTFCFLCIPSAGFWFHELEDLTIDGELTKEIANFRARNSNNSL